MKIRVNHNPCAWTCLTFFSLFKSAKATLKAVDGCDHSSECVATYWRTIWILILVVSLLYLISVAWTFWISNRVRKKYCYLCEDLVSKYDWVSGNHRRECQKHRMHKEFLARLPAPYAAIVCPDCKERLKLWPANRGPLYFTCDGENCIYENYELMNSGKERFVCFIHDFNLCRDCVQKSLKRREEPKTVLNKVNLAHPHGDLNCCSNAKIDHKTTKVSIDCELPTRPNRQSKPKMHHSKQSTPSVSDTRPTSEIEILDEESGQDAKKEDSRWSRSKSYAHAINT